MARERKQVSAWYISPGEDGSDDCFDLKQKSAFMAKEDSTTSFAMEVTTIPRSPAFLPSLMGFSLGGQQDTFSFSTLVVLVQASLAESLVQHRSALDTPF